MDAVLWLCPSLPTETLKWLSSLPILMHKSFWWWQCSDRYIISFSLHLHTPFPLFSPSLISRTVSVDVKHHVYLLTPPGAAATVRCALRGESHGGGVSVRPPGDAGADAGHHHRRQRRLALRRPEHLQELLQPDQIRRVLLCWCCLPQIWWVLSCWTVECERNWPLCQEILLTW